MNALRMNQIWLLTAALITLAAGCPRRDFDLGDDVTGAGSGAGNTAGGNPAAGSGTAGASGSGNGGGKVCGGLQGAACPRDQYCNFPIGAQCGAADQTGVCTAKPSVCTDEYAPVCGCDDKTYGNACEAAAAGVSIVAKGECSGSTDPGGQTCGGLIGRACPRGEYCDYPPDAMCGRADATGVCTAKPQACREIYQPVCGCDGKTYGNACEAATAGVSVEATGECGGGSDPGGQSCDSESDSCPAGSFCKAPAIGQCGGFDGGTCTKISTACTLEYAPVCGCDGMTYGNACAASSAGVNIATRGECAGSGSGNVCGVRGAPECAGGEYCSFPEAAQCGAADQPGNCAVKPTACTKELREVCGCDGKTYGNPCMAAAAGISVAHNGACEPSGQDCGGIAGLQCPAEQFCDYPVSAQCGAADQTGKCAVRPDVCTDQYDPVCGCDGKTYGNACEAAGAGVSVASLGACSGGGTGETCGGLIGATCPANQFCNYPIEAMCGAADQTGTCSDKPTICTLDYTPVCGCDGKTYGNACNAASAGVSIVKKGAC